MELSGEYTFDAPQALVWDALQDPNVLGAVMPGGQGFQQVGENQYTGNLLIKVGPVQGTFQGQIKLKDIKAPESYNIEVDGKGAPGFVKASGGLKLEARGSQTFMAYSGQAQVGGRIASVGQRLMDSAARSITRQSLDALNEYLKVKVAEQPAPPLPAAVPQPAAKTTPAPNGATPAAAPAAASTPPAPTSTYKPPSQLALGFNVARDVFNDFVPPKYQPWLLVAIVAVIALIIWLATR